MSRPVLSPATHRQGGSIHTHRYIYNIYNIYNIYIQYLQVRLEDIDIIGAIGDSDTAAFAARSRGGLDYFTEYWGTSFATGWICCR